MNRFFISFAAILTSGILGFAYGKEWIQIALLKHELLLKPNSFLEYPYFHNSRDTYLLVTLVFGILFLIQFILSVYFTVNKNWKSVFFMFLFTMITILAVMVNSAIK